MNLGFGWNRKKFGEPHGPSALEHHSLLTLSDEAGWILASLMPKSMVCLLQLRECEVIWQRLEQRMAGKYCVCFIQG